MITPTTFEQCLKEKRGWITYICFGTEPRIWSLLSVSKDTAVIQEKYYNYAWEDFIERTISCKIETGSGDTPYIRVDGHIFVPETSIVLSGEGEDDCYSPSFADIPA